MFKLTNKIHFNLYSAAMNIPKIAVVDKVEKIY